MSKYFDFKTQLLLGKFSQRIFNYIYPHALIYVGDTIKEYDFIRVFDGAKIELKTEIRKISSTPNFFFEKYSSLENKKLGGPWQNSKIVDNFIIYFILDDIYFEFNLKKLLKVLNKITDKYSDKDFILIKNKDYTSAGFIVKREYLLDLYNNEK